MLFGIRLQNVGDDFAPEFVYRAVEGNRTAVARVYSISLFVEEDSRAMFPRRGGAASVPTKLEECEEQVVMGRR